MDYTNIISAVIALISALVSAFLIPWIKERVGADPRTRRLRELSGWMRI